MKNSWIGEIVFLLALVVFSVIYYFNDISPFSRNTESKYFFIIVFIGLLFLIGLQILKNVIFILKDSASKEKVEEKSPIISGEVIKGILLSRMFFVVVSLLVLIRIIPFLGFFISSFLFLVVVLWRFSIKKLNAIIISAIYSVSVYFIFEILLSIRFPKGILF